MENIPKSALLVSVAGEDRVGVVSSVTGHLFEIGANLADTAYAVLGQGFEFSCVATFDGLMSVEELTSGLKALDTIGGARISVTPFPFALGRSDQGAISHIVEVIGGDRAGLIARMSEVLEQFEANIVRMNSRRLEKEDGTTDYRTRFAVNVPEGKVESVNNALSNTAGSLRLQLTMHSI